MIFPCVNTDADVCVAVVVNVVGVVDQDQDQLADLSIAFCSCFSSNSLCILEKNLHINMQ